MQPQHKVKKYNPTLSRAVSDPEIYSNSSIISHLQRSIGKNIKDIIQILPNPHKSLHSLNLQIPHVNSQISHYSTTSKLKSVKTSRNASIRQKKRKNPSTLASSPEKTPKSTFRNNKTLKKLLSDTKQDDLIDDLMQNFKVRLNKILFEYPCIN